MKLKKLIDNVPFDFNTITLSVYERTREFNGKKMKIFQTAYHRKRDEIVSEDFTEYENMEIKGIVVKKNRNLTIRLKEEI